MGGLGKEVERKLSSEIEALGTFVRASSSPAFIFLFLCDHFGANAFQDTRAV